MKRSKHNLSHHRLFSGNLGQLIPVGCVEVLPGDSFDHETSFLLRVSPLLAPVMHKVNVRLHHFFVPTRILYPGWEDFITGGSDGQGGSSGAYPYITTPSSPGVAESSLADYLGVPKGLISTQVSALPFRSYAKIFNEFYRDEDLVSAVGLSTGSGSDTTTNTALQSVAWEKDYATSARPWPQKGDPVTIPLSGSAPIIGRSPVSGVGFLAGSTTSDGESFRQTADPRAASNTVVKSTVQPFELKYNRWTLSLEMMIVLASASQATTAHV